MAVDTVNVQRIKSAPWLSAVIADTGLSKHAVLVASALFSRAGANGDRCFPSLDDLSERSRLCKTSLIKARTELVEAGYVVVSSSKGGRGNGAASYYTLTVPAEVAATMSEACFVAEEVKTREEHIAARESRVVVKIAPMAPVVPMGAVREATADDVAIAEAEDERRFNEEPWREEIASPDRYAVAMQTNRHAAEILEGMVDLGRLTKVAPYFTDINDDKQWRPVRNLAAKYLTLGVGETEIQQIAHEAIMETWEAEGQPMLSRAMFGDFLTAVSGRMRPELATCAADLRRAM